MNSTVATVALLLWPIVSAALFAIRPAVQATLWTIVGAQLLLPVGSGIKFEMIPPFDKGTLPSFCIFFGYLIAVRRPWHLRFGLAEVLLAIFLFGPVVTSMLNGDPVFAGNRVISGVGIYDAVSAVEFALITLLPFLVGRGLFRTEQANESIMKVLLVAGLLYSIPMLFEMRFSPQFHVWVYGYSPTDFIQQVRDGGYRPMVFMGHGLTAATFFFMTVVAAVALWRSDPPHLSRSSGGKAAYLAAVLVLCRSAGATVFALVVAPLVYLAKPKLQGRVAAIFVLLALFYPMLRVADMVPTRLMVDLAETVSVDRAASLGARFENETLLLDRALQRPVFGWGRYGRSRVYDSEGRDLAVTDGHWVITIGQFGILGFVAEFGLLALCVIKAAAASRKARSFKEKILLTALALIVATNVLDLLPNASLLPVTWLFSGALLGRAEALQQAATRLTISPSGSLGHPEINPSAPRFG